MESFKDRLRSKLLERVGGRLDVIWTSLSTCRDYGKLTKLDDKKETIHLYIKSFVTCSCSFPVNRSILDKEFGRTF